MLRPQAGIQVDKFYPPTDWLDNNNKQIDIRKNAENNSIVLLVGHSADFSKYSLLGFFADTSAGTYDVYIDDVLVGSGVTKNTQYDIDFSTINTSYGSATTPESLVLHKVVVKPTTSGATLTRFCCGRTTGVTTTQAQGVLWGHFELENEINIASLFRGGAFSTAYTNTMLFCVSAKGGVLKASSMTYASFGGSEKLSYLPQNNSYGAGVCFRDYVNKIINFILGATKWLYDYSYFENFKLELIKNSAFRNNSNISYSFTSARNLKMLPNINFSSATNMTNFLTEASNLYPTKLDVSSATGLTIIRTYGSSTYPMRGLRGLKVSNEAPFTGASPQINVGYTGLDRDALVELFQSLPTVTGGQTLNCVACSGNNLTVVGSPTITDGVVSGFSTSDYVKTAQSFTDNGDDLEIGVSFSTSILGNICIMGVEQGVNYTERPHLNMNNQGKINWKIRNNVSLLSSVKISANNKYKVLLKRKTGVYTMEIYNDLNELIDTTILESADLLGNGLTNTFCYGFDKPYYNAGFNNGFIYINETYIKVRQNYLMKGYITDTDKAIATDKGWGLVLS